MRGWRAIGALALAAGLAAPAALAQDADGGAPSAGDRPEAEQSGGDRPEASPSEAERSEAEGSEAERPLPEGREVARRINARDTGEKVSRRVVMRLVPEAGGERTRVARSFRRFFGEERRTVIFFLEPTTLRDTAFLTYDYPEPGREDDQWLYLSALRKTRRISATNRGDSFLGTDLSYEEVMKETRVAAADYEWRTLRRDTIEGQPCVVVEQVPASEEIANELGYGKVITWVDAEVWMVRRSEHFDLAGERLKSIHVSEIRKVDGIWTPHRTVARNHQTGHRTVFRFEEVDYEAEVPKGLFEPSRLRRGVR